MIVLVFGLFVISFLLTLFHGSVIRRCSRFAPSGTFAAPRQSADRQLDWYLSYFCFLWFSAASCQRWITNHMICANVQMIAKTIELLGFSAILGGCLPLR